MFAQAGLLDLSHRLERSSVSESLLGFLNVRRQRTKQIEREDQHLLDFEYDQANIESFRNLWGRDEIQDVGPEGERDYFIELRLAPPSGNFLFSRQVVASARSESSR